MGHQLGAKGFPRRVAEFLNRANFDWVHRPVGIVTFITAQGLFIHPSLRRSMQNSCQGTLWEELLPSGHVLFVLLVDEVVSHARDVIADHAGQGFLLGFLLVA
jgi:hypothetical protein